MSDSRIEWRAELRNPLDENSWYVVERAFDGHRIRVIFSNLDKATAHRLAAVNELRDAAQKQEDAELAHANCPECDGQGVPELCPKCFPLFDDARLTRRAALAKARGQ